VFTGIVAETGRVQSVRRNAESCRIRIEAHSLWTEMELGDSVSVSGVCLTVVHLEDGIFEADVSSESLQRSNLGSKRVGDLVNLELAVRVGGRLGGHIVLGHVDGMGSVVRNELNGEGAFLTVQYRGSGSHLVVEKGSVAVDGVSLTVASLVGEDFGVAVVPFTLQKTTLAGLRPGASVNIEVDVIGRYVEGLTHRKGAADLADLLRRGWSP